MTVQIIAFAIVFVYLAVLSYQDCKYRKLPNALTLGGALVALALRYGVGGFACGAEGLWGGLVCGLFLLLPFILRAAGGGDVKMLFACGTIVGLSQAAEMILFTSLAGLLLMIVMLVWGNADSRRVKHFMRTLFDWRYDRKAGAATLPPKDTEKCRVPFGVAIAVGTAATMMWRLMV